YIDAASWQKRGLQETSKQFFSEDYLSAVIGKLFYGDIIQLWWPWHLSFFDRMIGLERSLEEGYVSVTGKNTFSRDFLKIYDQQHQYPALFINTTEVESGLQCWISTVR